MKHAGPHTLALIEDLLAEIRTRKGLVEKKTGIFYRKGQAFLHFHEDRAGMFMDIRDGTEWLRLPVSGASTCLVAVDRALDSNTRHKAAGDP